MILEEVSRLFAEWRSNKQSQGNLIPEQLWEKVKLLQPHYRRAKICKALHISYRQFRKHCESESKLDTVLCEQEDFVQAQLSIAPPLMCELTLRGARKTLTLKVPDTQLNHLLPLLEVYL